MVKAWRRPEISQHQSHRVAHFPGQNGDFPILAYIHKINLSALGRKQVFEGQKTFQN